MSKTYTILLLIGILTLQGCNSKKEETKGTAGKAGAGDPLATQGAGQNA